MSQLLPVCFNEVSLLLYLSHIYGTNRLLIIFVFLIIPLVKISFHFSACCHTLCVCVCLLYFIFIFCEARKITTTPAPGKLTEMYIRLNFFYFFDSCSISQMIWLLIDDSKRTDRRAVNMINQLLKTRWLFHKNHKKKIGALHVREIDLQLQ